VSRIGVASSKNHPLHIVIGGLWPSVTGHRQVLTQFLGTLNQPFPYHQVVELCCSSIAVDRAGYFGF